MAILGNNTTPAQGFFFDHTGNSQFMSGAYTMPAGGGVVTDLWVYCAGDGASTSGQLCVWHWSGALAIQSGAITLPSGSEAIGGQGWQHYVVPNVYLPADTYGIGFWAAGNVVWTYESGGGAVDYQHSVAGGPTTMSPPGSESGGQLGAYIVYTPGGVAHVRRAGAWSAGVQPEVRRTGAWSGSTGAGARRTTSWNQGT